MSRQKFYYLIALFSEERLQRIKDYQDGTLDASVPVNTNNPQYWRDGYDAGNDNVDWYQALYRDYSFSQEHNMSISGGNEATQFYFSGNFLGQDGLMQFNRDAFERYALTTKINTRLSPWATFSTNTRFIREDYGRPSNMSDSFFQDLARQGWPTLPLYDPNGYLYSSPSPALGLRDGGRDESQKDWLYQQLQLVLEPVGGWQIFGELNYRTVNHLRNWSVQQTYNHDVDGNPYLYNRSSHIYEYAYRQNFLNPNIYSELNLDVNDHHFTVLAGFQAEKERYRDFSARRDGIIVPSITALNATSGTDASGNTVAPVVEPKWRRKN